MRLLSMFLLVSAACGGSKTKGPEGPGGGGEDGIDSAPMSAWGGGAPDANSSGTEEGDDGPGTTPGQTPTGPPAAVSFQLENKGTGDLIFAIDKGWQPVLFAYTGKPPKAKSVLLFPKACTGACDAPEEEKCPDCESAGKDIKKQKEQEKLETKREIAAEGKSVTVPWDGKVFVYEKAKKKCECWKKVDPEPGTYTVKACGLRPSTRAGKPSTAVCAEGQMTLPAAAGTTVTLSFAK